MLEVEIIMTTPLVQQQGHYLVVRPEVYQYYSQWIPECAVHTIAPKRFERLVLLHYDRILAWIAARQLYVTMFHAPSGPPLDADKRLERHGFVWQSGEWRYLKSDTP